MSPLLPRSCFASSSRLPLHTPTALSKVSPKPTSHPCQQRYLSLIPPRSPSSIPFFLPPFGLGGKHQVHLPDYGLIGRTKGKGKEVDRGYGHDDGNENRSRGGPGRGLEPDPEEEVDDSEWDIRVVTPLFAKLSSNATPSRDSTNVLRSTDEFFRNIPAGYIQSQRGFKITTTAASEGKCTFGLNSAALDPGSWSISVAICISSLSGYSMAFSLARSGMHALHTDLRTDLERMTFSPSPSSGGVAKVDPAAALMLSRRPIPAHRQKQIRVQVAVYGKPRLPPHHEAKWHTSSLYSFSPYSGLITSHEVETIRPLPGEGVAEWLMSRLLGWTSRQGANEGAVPCPSPRTIAVPAEHNDRSRLRSQVARETTEKE
ncbi:hypothetical protein I316_08035 [Kwoniella heveanensis BCC8398]|uniref:Uncharacterized protein n=1 Tax=Kwoniella heveanensis BCC8398 TaxID=1296120 RepID=A0A1B9GHB1_9TREE|nr:hypothetical protein I316_08035 [Kwoniella heveanensis BCC8398]